MDPRTVIVAARSAASSMPRWALPFYLFAAACLLVFGSLIWAVSRLCMSMRPLYERRR